jgi:hypothetical protein
MPMPTPHDVHIETGLTRFSIAYKNEDYIADQIFPTVAVAKQSDKYWLFPKSAWYRNEKSERAPGTRANRVDYDLTTASYVCINYALSKTVPDEVRKNADNPLKPDLEATEFVMDALLRGLEKRVADKTTGGSALWTTASTPSTQWSSDTSDPINDIEGVVNGIVSQIGRLPNVAVMSWDVWRYLKNHPDLVDRVKYTRPGAKPMPSDLMEWFGFKKVLIGTQLYDTGSEGGTSSLAYIWGDAMWMGYVPPSPALMTPAAGYTLEWETRQVRRYREDQERQDILEASHNIAVVISASDSGGVLYNVI